MSTPPIRKAVFPVGGLGTRFLPATKSMPKEMLPIVDKPLIHHAYEEARKAGIEQFIFITGRNKNAISNHFDHAYELQQNLSEAGKREELAKACNWLPEAGSISFIRQQQPLGLGHAIWCARHAIGNEPFAVLLADDFMLGEPSCLKQMLDAYQDAPNSHFIGTEAIAPASTRKYGVVDVAEQKGALLRLHGLVEKPRTEDAPSYNNTYYGVMGRYILQPDIFAALEHQKAGAGGEIQLTDAIHALCPSIPTYAIHTNAKRYDCGNPSGFLEANLAYGLTQPALAPQLRATMERLLCTL